MIRNSLLSLKSIARIALINSYYEYRDFLWQLNKKLRNSIIVSTHQGKYAVLTTDDAIGKSMFKVGISFEYNFLVRSLNHLRGLQLLPPKGMGTVIDIGANVGVISIAMLNTGEMQKALAIEPEPRNFSLLEQNVKLNGLEGKVICLPNAVSDQKGTLELELSENNGGDHRVRVKSLDPGMLEIDDESKRATVEIKSEQLDTIIEQLPKAFCEELALIWIDVQGHEGYVFRGARDVLSRDIPVVSEIWPYGIRRAGMSRKEFCHIVEGIWSNYWMLRNVVDKLKFVRYPIHTLDLLFDELGDDSHANANVIFTK